MNTNEQTTSTTSSQPPRPPISPSTSSSSIRSPHESPNIRRPSYSRALPSLAKVDTNGDPALAKRRARNLLRDYYGLASNAPDQSKKNEAGGEKLSSASTSELDLDSPYFDPQACFEKLVRDSSLQNTLATANRLMAEVRELDGERQSLVYNHHHELVEASVTIGKMKTSAETLDSTLDQLQNSFSAISELTTALTSTPREIPSKPHDGFDPSVHPLPLLNLPTILRGLSQNRAAADQLWGEWEPALRSFEEAGIEGARRIGNECREVLRQNRERS